ncbi:hypothetical protein GWI33_005917 [Rhynchophorus ferrugineus]|uniref:Uncharacterized protein n=1 Tax=Rhynchophorus ferrugineus TaxID=354439 RepID=A0A834IXT3_RHYFE|nr:hypothetical protein GWI33_005917 [Rhynchophorus ferrugineus]
MLSVRFSKRSTPVPTPMCELGTALDVKRKFTQAAPVPWPNNVTLVGSPPKNAIFSCIQCKAAIWSIRP